MRHACLVRVSKDGLVRNEHICFRLHNEIQFVYKIKIKSLFQLNITFFYRIIYSLICNILHKYNYRTGFLYMNTYPSKSSILLLVFIVFIAVCLRMYRFTDIPLSNDELSALNRTHFSSYYELVEKGIKVDGHPAGVQTFLYFWTSLMGDEAWIVRLPFILMGLASVVIIFQIGKILFTEECGLMAASSVCFLQYFITQTTYARPYASGLFFVLLMVWSGLFLFDNSTRFSWKHAVLFVTAATLALYNHYFSALQVVTIISTSIFFFPRPMLWKYVLLIGGIGLLYIPHLPIFWAQVRLGGIGGWVAPPDISFIKNYLAYLFHFSYWIILPVAVIGIGSFVNMWKKSSAQKTGYVLMWIWWLIPLLTGYAYSTWVAPVLHYFVLFFSTPFLLLAIYAGVPSLARNKKILFISVWCLIGTGSLIWERRHFELFYEGGTQSLVKHAGEIEQLSQSQQAVHHICVNHPFYADYYAKRYHPPITYASYAAPPHRSFVSFRQELREQPTQVLTFAWFSVYTPLEYLAIIREFYPELFYQRGYCVSEFYAFRKRKLPQFRSGTPAKEQSESSEEESLLLFHEQQDFDKYLSEYWSAAYSPLLDQNGANYVYNILPSETYSGGFSFKASSKLGYSDILISSVDVQLADTTSQASLILEINRGDEKIHWKASPIMHFVEDVEGWSKVHVAIRIWEEEFLCEECEVRAYIWNRAQESIKIDNFELFAIEGNPIIYGLVSPL